MFGLSKEELKILRSLKTPIKIQNFLDQLPINFEKTRRTYFSPRRVLQEKQAHCLEGALLAALALWLAGKEPLLLDLVTVPHDEDHVVALYRRGGYWGAISKTNHAALRFRDPVYKTVRELALSYFHEYFINDTGQKTLRSYSRPFYLKKLSPIWITAETDLDWLVEKLDRSPHFPIAPAANLRALRPADQFERQAGRLTEWPE